MASFAFTAGSRTTIHCQFCALLPVGAFTASSMHRRMRSSSTGSGFNRRIARWVRIASSSGMSRPTAGSLPAACSYDGPVQDRHQAPPQARVQMMFDDIVDRYDLVNRTLSLGLDRGWRRRAARAVRDRGRPVLDLGCGTGDLVRDVGVERTIGVDVSERML